MTTMRARLWALGLALALPFAVQAHDPQHPIGSTEGGSPVVSVSAGRHHSCALKTDGSVDCWGYNTSGQAEDQPGPFLSVAAGSAHTCGVKADGSVDCWGDNGDGQADDQPGPFLSVSAGSTHSCGVKADGSVNCWGDDTHGQAQDQPGPFLSVSAGSALTCGVKADGSVDCWGLNNVGQAEDQPGPFLSVSVSVSGGHACGVKVDGSVDCWGRNLHGESDDQPGPFLSVSPGSSHTCGVKTDGSVDCWGFNNPSGSSTDWPGPFLSVSTGGFHACGLKADGAVFCWGSGWPGSSGFSSIDPHAGQSTVPSALQFDPSMGSGVVSVSAGRHHSCALKTDGSVDCWGYNTSGQAEDQPGPFLSVSAGSAHTCGVKAEGSVDCWGDNGDGQAEDQPGQFLSVATGSIHSCGLKADGSVDCWGANTHGEAEDQPGPFQSVSAGSALTCGVKADGSVDCWGLNNIGQAEDQPGPFLSVSVSVSGGHACGVTVDGSVDCWGRNLHGESDDQPGPFLSVSPGSSHTCGVKTDGSVDCWGFNNPSGSATDWPGPFLSVSTGGFHACGLKANGAVFCWGSGWPGGTGLSTGDPHAGQSSVPSELYPGGAAGFGQIAAGNAHACDLQRNGRIRCWGANDEGQATPPAGRYTQVVAGDSHSCAIGTDSKVTCWGRNDEGNTANADLVGGLWRQLAPASDGALCALSASGGLDVCVRSDIRHNAFDHALFLFRNITHAAGTVPDLCGVRLDTGGAGYCIPNGFDAAHGSNFPGPWQRLESGLNHQCGLKSDGGIECWGENLIDGQLDNLPASTETFRALSVGWNHACAIRTDGQLACWGSNLNGQTDAPAGEYVQVAAGNTFACAIRNDGQRVCWGANDVGTDSPNPASLSDLPDGVAGVAYSQQIGIHGASPPADPVFVQMSGTLPPELSLTSGGLLAGTPSTVGSFTFSVDAEGTGGFAATRSYTLAIADGTPPTISYAFTPATPDGDNGWHVGDVGIDWTVGDADSAIQEQTGCDDNPAALTSDTSGATFTCTASSAGGSNSVTTASIKRDATAPTLAPVLPSPILLGGSYSANPNASDATSGVAASSCGALDTTNLGDTTTTCTAADNAGNVTTVDLPYSVITSCSNEGYTGAKLTWCRNICEMGYTGAVLRIWIHRWISRYRDLPYCVAGQEQADA